METVRQLGVFTLLDEGSGICNAVYVDDVCDAIHSAIDTERGLGGAFFITADRAVSWREFNLAFAEMVVPPARITSVSSDEVRHYWAEQRPTLKSNIRALAGLAASVDFHRQASSVPVLRALIRGGKGVVKPFLSPERLAALKGVRDRPIGNRGGAGAGIPWPDLGRVTRECMRIEFSNERARTLLGWQPRYGLPAGVAITRSWLESAPRLRPS